MVNYNIIPIQKQQRKLRIKYFTGEEMLTSDQRKMTEQDKFPYSPLGKTN